MNEDVFFDPKVQPNKLKQKILAQQDPPEKKVFFK